METRDNRGAWDDRHDGDLLHEPRMGRVRSKTSRVKRSPTHPQTQSASPTAL